MNTKKKTKKQKKQQQQQQQQQLRTDYGSSAYTIIFLKTLPGQQNKQSEVNVTCHWEVR